MKTEKEIVQVLTTTENRIEDVYKIIGREIFDKKTGRAVAATPEAGDERIAIRCREIENRLIERETLRWVLGCDEDEDDKPLGTGNNKIVKRRYCANDDEDDEDDEDE